MRNWPIGFFFMQIFKYNIKFIELAFYYNLLSSNENNHVKKMLVIQVQLICMFFLKRKTVSLLSWNGLYNKWLMVKVFPTFPEIILSKLCSLVTMQIFLKVKMFLSMVNAALALPILDLLLCATLSVNHILKLDKGLNVSDGPNCDWWWSSPVTVYHYTKIR